MATRTFSSRKEIKVHGLDRRASEVRWNSEGESRTRSRHGSRRRGSNKGMRARSPPSSNPLATPSLGPAKRTAGLVGTAAATAGTAGALFPTRDGILSERWWWDAEMAMMGRRSRQGVLMQSQSPGSSRSSPSASESGGLIGCHRWLKAEILLSELQCHGSARTIRGPSFPGRTLQCLGLEADVDHGPVNYTHVTVHRAFHLFQRQACSPSCLP